MARANSKRSRRLAKVHDRRSHDLPFNAEVAAVEVDDPLALEPGDKIVALRSIRNDPLGRLHSHRQIDDVQYRAGRAFQGDWERAERGPQAVDPTRELCRWRANARADHRGPAQGRIAAQSHRARARRRRLRAGPRRAGQGHDDGAGGTAPRAEERALERLLLAPVSRVPRPVGAGLRLCDGEAARRQGDDQARS